ncbi:MAG: type II secretion system F family protein [Candidatus Levyibacteriota bacterium]
MKLSYKAVSRDGKIVHGFIDARDINEAATYLRNNNFLPIRISPYQAKLALPFSSFFKKFGGFNLMLFTRQLSLMLASGLTLTQSLNVLKEQVKGDMTQEVVSTILTDIEGGKSLSLALLLHTEIFPPIYISLIKAAESSGLLEKVLLRLADNLEKEKKLKDSIKSALLYPAIVIIGMVAVVFIMMIFVIPQLSTLYESMNIQMPLPTRIVIGMSNFLVTFWPLIIGLAIILTFVYRRWNKTESGKLIIDSFKLKIPIFGKLSKEIILTEFSRTFSLLVGAGILVVEALNQVAEITGNILYKNAVTDLSKRVEKGMTVGDSMMYSNLFPPILVQMAKIGEQTGKLDESFLKVSEYFEQEVDQTVKTLMTALEPMIMIILGVGVAFLIISIITPIYSLMSAIQ